MHKTRTFPCMNTPLKCYRATHHATVLTVCMGASWPFPSNCIECVWWQPLYFGNYNFFNFFIIKDEPANVTDRPVYFFYKKNNKKKNNKIKQNPPGAHTHTHQACSGRVESELKHNTRTGGVEPKELSACIPERDFSLFPMPFRIGPIRKQLLWNWALPLASCFLLATVGGWDIHTYKTHTERGWGCDGGWRWRQSVLFSKQIGVAEPPAGRREGENGAPVSITTSFT